MGQDKGQRLETDLGGRESKSRCRKLRKSKRAPARPLAEDSAAPGAQGKRG